MAVGRRTRTADVDRTVVTDRAQEAAPDTWELDGADSWEPIVPETWAVPPDAEPAASEPFADDTGSAGWSDAARSDEEWVDAARHGATPVGVSRDDTSSAPVGIGAALAADVLSESEAENEESLLTRAEWAESHIPAQEPAPNPARMALGLASMAAQRLRGDVPVGDGFVTGVGLMQETANGLAQVGRRILGPAAALARGAVRGASRLPVVGVPFRVARRTRAKLSTALADARTRGAHTVEAGRVEAERMLRRVTGHPVVTGLRGGAHRDTAGARDRS
jgi:hypothetical protein